jgi:hypothetical protein
MVERAKLAGWEAGTDTVEAMAGSGYAESSLVPGLPPSLESGRGQLTLPLGEVVSVSVDPHGPASLRTLHP